MTYEKKTHLQIHSDQEEPDGGSRMLKRFGAFVVPVLFLAFVLNVPKWSETEMITKDNVVNNLLSNLEGARRGVQEKSGIHE